MLTKLEYLHRMGIDVWAPRGASPQQEESVLSMPRLLLSFLDYGELGICCSLNPDSQSMPGDVRRICDDVAHAVLRKGVRPSINDLRWPTSDSSAPLGTVRDLVQQTLEKMPENVVVFGSEFAHYVLDVEDIVVGNVTRQEKRNILVADDIQSTIGDSELKKVLWSSLKAANFIHGYSRP